MGTFTDLERSGLRITPELHLELLKAQEKVLREVKRTWFFQYLEIEMYESGTIKNIRRGLDWKGVISIGAVTLLFGVAIYIIGPPAVVKVAKHMLSMAATTSRIATVLP
ncbi:unnamed protein product [Rotaria socialis]|uniref:Uncharacterized protein n=1 Tax=Rotaria socialis TaxID=392032 RepID=A0A821VNH6_9BILA|nr:unnamed protein product [Rotaria socialis]CAF4909974.1 unnamed protein product [Rotaria socialis]